MTASRIAFVSNQDGSSDIFTMDPDGGRLSDGHANDHAPDWQPALT